MSLQIRLISLPVQLKKFLIFYLITLSIGVAIGLIYVSQTTSMNQNDVVERWKGSQISENEIPEQYEKSFSEMLMTTHNHIISFSFIFLQVGLIFYFNSIIQGRIKTFLMVEPFISILLTFGSIWLVRFYMVQFVYLTFISAVLMYFSFYLMVSISIYDLCKKSSNFSFENLTTKL